MKSLTYLPVLTLAPALTIALNHPPSSLLRRQTSSCGDGFDSYTSCGNFALPEYSEYAGQETYGSGEGYDFKGWGDAYKLGDPYYYTGDTGSDLYNYDPKLAETMEDARKSLGNPAGKKMKEKRQSGLQLPAFCCSPEVKCTQAGNGIQMCLRESSRDFVLADGRGGNLEQHVEVLGENNTLSTGGDNTGSEDKTEDPVKEDAGKEDDGKSAGGRNFAMVGTVVGMAVTLGVGMML